MNCETCQNELEDFLYGELGEARANTLRAHLRVCGACTHAQATLEREQELFTKYYEQTAADPSDVLWRSIQTRIQAERPVGVATALTDEADTTASRWWHKFSFANVWMRQTAFAAALVLVSVAATTLFFKWQTQPNGQKNDGLIANQTTPTPQPSPKDVQTAPPKTTPDLSGVPQIIPVNEQRKQLQPAQPALPKLSEEQVIQNQLARAEREYQQAIKLLDRVIARKSDQLDPAVKQQYESSLALIDNSIAESRRALRGEPNNAVSSQFLLAAYAKKLELMREIAMQAGQ